MTPKHSGANRRRKRSDLGEWLSTWHHDDQRSQEDSLSLLSKRLSFLDSLRQNFSLKIVCVSWDSGLEFCGIHFLKYRCSRLILTLCLYSSLLDCLTFLYVGYACLVSCPFYVLMSLNLLKLWSCCVDTLFVCLLFAKRGFLAMHFVSSIWCLICLLLYLTLLSFSLCLLSLSFWGKGFLLSKRTKFPSFVPRKSLCSLLLDSSLVLLILLFFLRRFRMFRCTFLVEKV